MSTLPIVASFACRPCASTKSKSSPSRKCFISLLQNCKHISQIPSIHAKIIRNNHDQDPFIIFELLRICSNLNSIIYASKIFSYTRNPNVYLYTALIDGFVLSGYFIDGIHLYYQMINSSILPDNYVITSVLKACGCQLALKQGREIHCQVLKLGLSSNRSVRMKLMEIYGKCGALNDAQQVFDEMPEQDVAASTVMLNSYFDCGLVQEATIVFDSIKAKDTVCWTAMIDGLVRNGEMYRALVIFREMQEEQVRPNEVTILRLLSACSQLRSLELGRWMHSYMRKYWWCFDQYVFKVWQNLMRRGGFLGRWKR